MASTNVTFNPSTPWTQYYCSKSNPCTVPNTTCHYNKYCIPTLAAGETCKDDKDVVDPFVARIDNVYSLFCDMPTELAPQSTKCPLGCEVWEDCHSDVCFVKKCTKDQTACKNGDIEMCNGLRSDEIFCWESSSLTSSSKSQAVEETGLSGSQIGGIAGGVSAAVIVLAAVGGFFLIRRRRLRAAKAKTHGSEQSLPTYSAQDEKNAMKQVTVSA
ncbi:hypothetical protein BGX21_009374 [Mortierella sp. AD011]|nr:hypothetical protein BGX20_002166 [Mortierella sp. AD010]KAF9402628.1 hypothetical protein BGX21_009374 [Mortierella sp. AD011]